MKSASDDTSARGGLIRRLCGSDTAFYLITAAIMVVIGAVNSATKVSDRRMVGVTLPLWESVLWEATSATAVFLLLPGLTWLAKRFPWDARPPWRTMAVHLAATVPFSLAHILLMDLFRWAAYAAIGRGYAVLELVINEGLYEYRKDVVSYAAILGIYWAWRRLSAPPAVVIAPANSETPPTLEVRDGARRVYVGAGEIEWIEAAGNYAQLHLAGGRTRLHRSSLAALEAQLASCGFVRVHRSRLVNRAEVAEIAPAQAGDFTVTLRSGATVGGSRRFRTGLMPSTAA